MGDGAARKAFRCSGGRSGSGASPFAPTGAETFRNHPPLHKARRDMIYALPISIVAMLGYMFWNTAYKMRKDIDRPEE